MSRGLKPCHAVRMFIDGFSYERVHKYINTNAKYKKLYRILCVDFFMVNNTSVHGFGPRQPKLVFAVIYAVKTELKKSKIFQHNIQLLFDFARYKRRVGRHFQFTTYSCKGTFWFSEMP